MVETRNLLMSDLLPKSLLLPTNINLFRNNDQLPIQM